MSPNQVGIYDKAAGFANQPQAIINMNINSVFFSSFCSNKNNLELLQDRFRKNLSLLGVINLPVYTGLVTIAPYFVYVLLGDKWEQMIIPLQIMCLSAICNSITSVAANMNIAMGKYSVHTKILFALLMVFIVTVFSVVDYGLVAIACAALLYNILKVLFLVGYCLKNISLSWSFCIKSILPSVIGSILMFLINTILAIYMFDQFTFANLIFLVVIGALVYAGYIYFIDKSPVLDEYRRTAGSIVGNIKKAIHKIVLKT
jgi:O-antigen/teichoic acid export membrane protein